MSATEVLTAANAVPFLGQPETQEATMPELRLYLDSESQGAAVDGVDATDEELAGSGDVGGARRADAQAPKVADQRIVEAGVKEQAMACTRRDEATSEGEQPQSPPAASLPGKGETVSEASPGQSSPEALGTGHDASAQQVPDSQRKNKSIFSTDDLSDSDVELDLGYTSSPPAAASKKAFSRLKKRNTSPREDCSRPDALDGLIDKSPPVHHRRNRALAIDSDAEEDHDVVHGRLSKGGQSEEEDGEGREDDDNEDSGAQHPGDENSVDLEELNRRTQAALREAGRNTQVGGCFQPPIKPLSGVLQKLRQLHEDAAKLAPVLHIEEEDTEPESGGAVGLLPLEGVIEDQPLAVDSDDELEFDEAMAGSDAKVLPNSAGEEEYVSQPGSAASGEDNDDDEEEEEEVPAVPMLAPARLASRRLKGFVESRYLTAKELENLDLATANRVPEGLMQDQDEEEDVIVDDYEAMEQGSDAESEGWGQDEEEEEEEPAAEQDESSDEEQDQDDGTDHGNEEDSDEGIDEAGDEGLPEDLSEERTARRRTVKLGALSDEDEDEDAGQGEVTARGRHTASGRGEAASFLEMEAEMSGDEGHDGEEDDDDDAEDGMLKDLIGTAKEGARDEAIRAKMHAEWEAQKDAEELKLAMLAKHHGYRRGVVDIEEEDEDRAARRRRAAAEDDDDCEANCQLADVVDLMHDEEDELAELPHYLDGPDREMLQDLTRRSTLDIALEEDGSQEIMRILDRTDSRLTSTSDEQMARVGSRRFGLGGSRLGLLDASNQETSNHASFLGRTSSAQLASGKGGGKATGHKSTFTFTMGGGSQHAEGAGELPPSQTDSAEVMEMSRQSAGSEKLPASFAGLIPKTGEVRKATKRSHNLVNILGKQISEAGSSKQDFGSFDLAKALKKRLGAK